MEEFSHLIQCRRSIRRFTEEELTQDEVVALLRAALMAPSSKGTRCWQFIVVDDRAMLERLSHCKEHGAELLAGASLAVVVLGDPMVSDVWIEDASIASLVIQLQAEDLGLGSCWVQVREALDIPLQLQVLSIIAVGHKAVERKPIDESGLQWEKVHINHYGGQ